ncbi:hypothetical protein GSI_13288 [Ganoderma sinense ZZ0214-1]|uniref:Uncharacterized protein n=1 Tax=Ganoderma sinense ZZ0214-1 TaxID=1077348 RepID=A0A2G8RVP2_9APHY|nr:hypothetical protein GSI_13288 [Ganoderma sinense ZZ0214-1]
MPASTVASPPTTGFPHPLSSRYASPTLECPSSSLPTTTQPRPRPPARRPLARLPRILFPADSILLPPLPRCPDPRTPTLAVPSPDEQTAEARWQPKKLSCSIFCPLRPCFRFYQHRRNDPANSCSPQLNRRPVCAPARQYGPIWCVSSVVPAWITEADEPNLNDTYVSDTIQLSASTKTDQPKPSPGIRHH